MALDPRAGIPLPFGRDTLRLVRVPRSRAHAGGEGPAWPIRRFNGDGMPSETISVAMATCEGAAFVADQLESIAAQTRAPDELIICDDASTDETLQIIEAFAEKTPFPTRIETAMERKGATANFESALSLCQGSIILLADQDDVWKPNKIDKLTTALEAQPDAGLVFSNGEIVDAHLQSTGHDLWKALFFTLAEQRRVQHGEAPAVFARRVVAAGTTLAFRARFLDLLLPFPDLPSIHDAWIAFIIACQAPCALVDSSLIQYRLHGKNQIGIRPRGLIDQIRQARQQITRQAFDQDLIFFRGALERLCSQSPGLSPESPVRTLIEEKIAHSQVRSEMAASIWQRIPVVSREWLSGRYNRCAYGWKSAAQDLWLR